VCPFEGCDDEQEASVISGELVVSGGDASEVFDFAEEALDEVAFLIEGGIEAAPLSGGFASRNDGDGDGAVDGTDGALPVIGFVCHDVARIQAIEQWFDLGDVVALTTGEDEANRTTQGIGCDMDLGRQAAL
jgi:hypothetical protein